MESISRVRKTLAVACLGMGLALALALAAGPFAIGAAAQSGELVAAPENQSVTGVPRPIKLRPWVQFGHALPGETARYNKLLFNHLDEETDVTLDGDSLNGWEVRVVPSNTVAIPGYANVIHVGVTVPDDPARRVDIERVQASVALSGTTSFTTTAYMITITHRHPFTDLEEGNWADDPVQYLVDQGVITGYTDGTFRPGDNVTRAQFAKMLVGAMGWEVVTPQTPTFIDVTADYWAYGYIETAAAHGVIGGYTDGSFRPSADITRAQLAKMLFIARDWSLESPTMTEFSDVNWNDWFYSYTQAASSAEVMSGYEDHTFRPNAPATRAQVAKILALGMFSDPNN
jgi:hypothetical protein